MARNAALRIVLMLPLTGFCRAESNLVIEAENTPAASIADGVLRRQGINFVYSNSRLGIGTNRPPKIEIYISKPAPNGDGSTTNRSKIGGTAVGAAADEDDPHQRMLHTADTQAADGTDLLRPVKAVDRAADPNP